MISIVKAFSIPDVIDCRGDCVATGEVKLPTVKQQMTLHAHPGAGFSVQMTGSIILPFNPAGLGVEGINVGTVKIRNAGRKIGNFVFNEYTTRNRPRGEQRTIDRYPALCRSRTKPPEQPARPCLEGIDPPVAGAYESAAFPDGRWNADRAACIGLPPYISGSRIEGPHDAVGTAGEYQAASSNRGCWKRSRRRSRSRLRRKPPERLALVGHNSFCRCASGIVCSKHGPVGQ
ncbi:hypothetical protein ES703_70551 [subsurface metagenome]